MKVHELESQINMFEISLRNSKNVHGDTDEALAWLLQDPSLQLKKLETLLEGLNGYEYHSHVKFTYELIEIMIVYETRYVKLVVPCLDKTVDLPSMNCTILNVVEKPLTNMELFISKNPKLFEIGLQSTMVIPNLGSIIQEKLPEFKFLRCSNIYCVTNEKKSDLRVHIDITKVEMLEMVPRNVKILRIWCLEKFQEKLIEYITSEWLELNSVHFGYRNNQISRSFMFNLLKYRDIDVTYDGSDSNFQIEKNRLLQLIEKFKRNKFMYVLKYIRLQPELLEMLFHMLI